MMRRALLLALLGFLIAASTLRFPVRAVPASAKPEGGVPLPVVMYHHIREKGGWGQDVISPPEFAADLDELLRRGYETVTLAQVLDCQQTGAPLPEKPVLITFDDGFESILRYATPELKARGMTAAAFVLTGQTDAYQAVSAEQRHVSFAYLSWDDLEELVTTGVWEIGNHTHALHHAQAGGGFRKSALPLPGESYEQYLSALRADIGLAQEKLKEHVGTAPNAFAYPYGFYSQRSEEALRALGFSMTFITERGVSSITRDPDSLR